MVGVVAAMGGEIESNGETLLPGCKVAPVEGIGIFRRGETGTLPDRPRLRDIHGGVGAAEIRRQARVGFDKINTAHVLRPVARLYGNALRRHPRNVGGLRRWDRRLNEVDCAEIRNAAHQSFSIAPDRDSSTYGLRGRIGNGSSSPHVRPARTCAGGRFSRPHLIATAFLCPRRARRRCAARRGHHTRHR